MAINHDPLPALSPSCPAFPSLGSAWFGRARLGDAGLGPPGPGVAWNGNAVPGKARQGEVYMTPCLRSARLLMVPYTPMLVTEEHVGWLNDKTLMQFSEQRLRPHTIVTQMGYTGDATNPDRHLWLIRCEEKDIGTLSAYVDENNSNANLGILLGSRHHHGMGFAAESWCAVIDWLFSNGIHKVACGTRDDNHRMRRLATTTGMTLEAEIPGHFKVGDTWRGLVLYGRFRHEAFHSEWQKMWQPPFWKPGV